VRRLLAAVVALALLGGPAAASAAAPRASFNDVEKSVMCVSCNVPLTIAESPQADRTRAQIRVLIAQGLTKQQILDRLVGDYGPNVLAEPKAQGFNAVAYGVPIAAVLGLVGLGLVLLPRWRRSRSDEPPPAAGDDLSADDARRLDAELARFGA
jgi:cytochrome c-type biogenesis protein CcmH